MDDDNNKTPIVENELYWLYSAGIKFIWGQWSRLGDMVSYVYSAFFNIVIMCAIRLF